MHVCMRLFPLAYANLWAGLLSPGMSSYLFLSPLLCQPSSDLVQRVELQLRQAAAALLGCDDTVPAGAAPR